jgi:WD repeat-containing protein 61
MMCKFLHSQFNLSLRQNNSSVAHLSGHGSWVLSVAANPNGKSFATGSSDAKVKVWDLGQRQCVQTFQQHEDQVWAVAYNEAGTQLVSGGDDKSLAIYNVE